MYPFSYILTLQYNNLLIKQSKDLAWLFEIPQTHWFAGFSWFSYPAGGENHGGIVLGKMSGHAPVPGRDQELPPKRSSAGSRVQPGVYIVMDLELSLVWL